MPFTPNLETRQVVDHSSNVSLSIYQPGGDTTALTVSTTGLTETPLEFSMDVPRGDDRIVDGIECGVKILVGGVDFMFKMRGMNDVETNTEIFSKILEGIFTYNATWPLSKPPIICSDINEAIKRNIALRFSMPSNSALAEIFG